MTQAQHLSTLKELAAANIAALEQLAVLPLEKLQSRPHPKAWNALESIQHIVLYSNHYNAAIANAIAAAKASPKAKDQPFKSTWFGKKFTSMMQVKEDELNKMNTFKSKNPLGHKLSNAVLAGFKQQQKELLEIISSADEVNLNNVKCRLAIPLLKANLGDTMAFHLAHNERHLVQAFKSAGLA